LDSDCGRADEIWTDDILLLSSFIVYTAQFTFHWEFLNDWRICYFVQQTNQTGELLKGVVHLKKLKTKTIKKNFC